jgi:hypothetical protein
MNRRLFLTTGISMIALSRMAKALGDSLFFRGTISDGPFLQSEVNWKRGAQGLEIQVPGTPPSKYAFSFKILPG